MEKYKHLRKLEKDILQFMIRYKKEYASKVPKNELKSDVVKLINTLDINVNVYLDIINLICDKENNFTSKILFDEIASKIKNNSFYTNYKIDKTKSNEHNIMNFIAQRMDNFSLLTEPIFYLFGWYGTLNGEAFYGNLNKIVREELLLYNVLLINSFF